MTAVALTSLTCVASLALSERSAYACEAFLGLEYRDPPERIAFGDDEIAEGRWIVASRLRNSDASQKQLVRPDDTLNRFGELVTLNVRFRSSASDLARERAAYLKDVAPGCAGVSVERLAAPERSSAGEGPSAPDGELLYWSAAECYGAPPRHGIVRFLVGRIGLHRFVYERRGALSAEERRSWQARAAALTLERRFVSSDPRIDRAQWAVWEGDYTRARALAEELTRAGLPEGDAILGGLYNEGWGVEANPERARLLLERAAGAGSARAAFELARLHDEGRAPGADPEAALRWYRRAAEGGELDARARLGRLLMPEVGSAPAETLVTPQGGDSEPASEPTQIDTLPEATRWLRSAAEGGHLHARYWLANLLAEGAGVEQDLAAAVELYQTSARGGEPDAQFALGRLYTEGRGVPHDADAAIRWLTRAVMQGEDQARAYYHEHHGRGRTAPSTGRASP